MRTEPYADDADAIAAELCVDDNTLYDLDAGTHEALCADSVLWADILAFGARVMSRVHGGFWLERGVES